MQTGFRYAAENGYELAVRVDGDGQHDPAELARARRGRARGRGRHLRRLALRRRRRVPLVAGAARRHPHPGAHRLAAHRPARHRHDERLPGAEPQGDRAVRRRLPARLSRGRGGADAAQAPAAPGRGAGDDARAGAGALVDPRLPHGLLHGEGDARDPDRRACGAGRRRWRTHDPRRPGHAAQGLARRGRRVAAAARSSSSS